MEHTKEVGEFGSPIMNWNDRDDDDDDDDDNDDNDDMADDHDTKEEDCCDNNNNNKSIDEDEDDNDDEGKEKYAHDDFIRKGAQQVLLGLRTQSGRVLLRASSMTSQRQQQDHLKETSKVQSSLLQTPCASSSLKGRGLVERSPSSTESKTVEKYDMDANVRDGMDATMLQSNCYKSKRKLFSNVILGDMNSHDTMMGTTIDVDDDIQNNANLTTCDSIPRKNSCDLKGVDEEIIINDSDASFDRYFVSGSARRRLKQKKMKHMTDFESLEYSTYRTGYGREARMRKNLNWNVDNQRYDIHIPRAKVMIGWIMLLFIAIILGFVFFFMAISSENIYGARWGIIFHIASITTNYGASDIDIENGYASTGASSPAYIKGMMALFPVFVVLNMSLACASSLLVVYLSPGAQGSGLPEMRAYLNGIKMDDALSFKAFVAKVLGNIFATSSGLLVGKEGPLLQIGCIVASLMTQGRQQDRYEGHKKCSKHVKDANGTSKQTYSNMRNDFFGPFKTNIERRDLVTAGAATGIAVGFNAPIGGIIFAFEQVSTWWRNELTWKTFFCCAIGVIVLRMFNGFCSSSNYCGYYIPEREFAFWKVSFDTESVLPDSGSFFHIMIDKVPVVVIGLLCGLLGALYVSINAKLLLIRKRYLKSASWHLILEVIIISLLTSTVTFWLPMFFGQCHAGVLSSDNDSGGSSQYFEKFIQYNCGKGQYNDLALLFTGSQTNSIKRLYTSPSTDVRSISLQSLAIFGCQIFVLIVITNGIAIPSGIFTPCILIGACIGRFLGILFQELNFASEVDIGICALLGSAAFVAGVLRRTVSLGVVLIEVSSATAIVPSLMLSMLLSKSVADRFNPSLVDEQSRIKEIPFMPQHPKDITRGLQLQAVDVMSKTVKSLRPCEMVINVINMLQTCTHSAFPVLDGQKYKGIVTRQQLLASLKSGLFYEHQNEMNVMRHSPTRHRFTQSNVVRNVATSSNGNDNYDNLLDIHPRYMNHFVDLWPYILPNPVVEADTPFEMTYDIFRAMALRTLPVVHHFVEVVGMISRNDCLNVEGPVLRRLNSLSHIDSDARKTEDQTTKASHENRNMVRSDLWQGPEEDTPLLSGYSKV